MKKHWLFATLAALIICVICFTLFPTEAKAVTDGYLTYEIIDGEAFITDCDDTFTGSLTIPDTLGGYPVTTIAEFAFAHLTNPLTIHTGNSVVTISDAAFLGNTGLTSITLGDSVQTIGSLAFEACDNLGSFAVSANNPYFRTVDGVLFSKDATVLFAAPKTISGEYTVPAGVLTVGDYAFDGCMNLAGLTIGDDVIAISARAFNNCMNLKTVKLGSCVTTIANYAFSNCNRMSKIFIPVSTTTISDHAFYRCTALTDVYYAGTQTQWEAVNIGSNNDPLNAASMHYESSSAAMYDPEHLTYGVIDGGAVITDCDWYFECDNYTIPSTLGGYQVVAIGDYAFAGCEYINALTIPEGVTSIGYRAFANCYTWNSITVPKSVTSIGDDAFFECLYLTDVYYCGTEDQWKQISIGTGNHHLYNASIHFADPEYLSYNIYEGGAYIYECDESATGIITVPDTLGGYPVVGVDPWAFQDCDTITEIHLPDSVTYVGINAFAYCDNLTTVTMSDNVTVIGEGAFAGCTSLTDFDLPDNIAMLEASTFYGCASLTEITIPHGIAVIGESAFNNCGNLTRVEIPTSVSIIEDYAFANCTSLTEITIPHGVTSIGESVFYKCTSLKSISLPNTLTTIGQYAFKECTWLKSIAIPDSVTTVGNNAFEYCSNLKSAVVGSGLTEIPSGLFWANVSMTNITFSSTLVSIPDGAFYFCDNLTDVYYRGTAQQMALIEDNDARTAAATWHCDSCIGTDVHDYEETVTRASLADDGYITRGCTVCGATGETTVIPRVDAFSLPGHILIADGTQKRPVPTVWDREGNALTEGVDYTVTYPANAVEAGDYDLRITLTGNYSGEKILHYAIEPALEITKQPTTQKVKAGATAKFTVGTVGFGVDYQWQSSTNGTTWKNCSSSSATNATFSFTSKTSHNGNYYRCVITDHEGNVVCTDAVRLYVLGVTTQPKTAKVKTGSTAKFTVKATGDGLKYQWQSSSNGKTWKNCSSSSATKATFSFTSKTSHSSNYYRCKITDSEGNVVYTNAVRLYVLGVTKQPTTQKVAAGKTVKFTVTATGAGKTYQWQVSTDGGKTWKNCSSSSATKATFSFTSKTSHNGNYYRCRIKDNGGNTVYTDAVKLYVLGITEQPVSKTVTKGKTAKFTVEATGASKTYQWQVSTDGGKTWKNCSSTSAKRATFSFTAKTSHNGNYYRCRVKDSGGNTVYTNKVKLTVK